MISTNKPLWRPLKISSSITNDSHVTIHFPRQPETRHQASSNPVPTLPKVGRLIEALNANGIRYCHWKSNIALGEGLAGLTDIDLLVHRHDADAFRLVLAQCRFRPAGGPDGGSFPSTEHYFGLDKKTARLVHVHAYFKVITGESLAKNFHLPIEEMLLENTRMEQSVRVPTKGAELVVFTIRMLLKHTTLVELALFCRDRKSFRKECASLIDADSIEEAVQLVEKWLPTLDRRLFEQCVLALRVPAPLLSRLRLARRVRSSLRLYIRKSQAQASWSGLTTFTRMLMRRLAGSPERLRLRSGGVLVAFIGPEATGKTTLINEIYGWLGEHFGVERVHAGKPPSTKMTFIPNMAVPLLRVMAPALRLSKVESGRDRVKEETRVPWVYPMSFAIRSVLLAYDRRALLSRAFARASNGMIVLCDRYPYVAHGSPDGPKLMDYPLSRGRYPIRHMLAGLERKLYLQTPEPDLILCLTIPVKIAIARNRSRGKKEPEDYVRRRHAAGVSVPDSRTPVCLIDTNHPLEDTVRDIKRTIWEIL